MFGVGEGREQGERIRVKGEGGGGKGSRRRTGGGLRERELVWGGGRAGPHLAVLLVVADEVPQLLLAALQRGVQLLHLARQVRLLALQALPVGFHGYGGRRARQCPGPSLADGQRPRRDPGSTLFLREEKMGCREMMFLSHGPRSLSGIPRTRAHCPCSHLPGSLIQSGRQALA